MKKKKTIIAVSLIFPFLILLTTAVSAVNDNLEFYSKTDKYLLKQIDTNHTNLYYLGVKSYSSQFYSAGKIQSLTAENFNNKILGKEDFIIIIENKDHDKIHPAMFEKLKRLSANQSSTIYKNN